MKQKEEKTPKLPKPTKPRKSAKTDPVLEDTNKRTKVTNVKVVDPGIEFDLGHIDPSGAASSFNCTMNITIAVSQVGSSFITYNSSLQVQSEVNRDTIRCRIPLGDENFPTGSSNFNYTITVTMTTGTGSSTESHTGTTSYNPSSAQRKKTSGKRVAK